MLRINDVFELPCFLGKHRYHVVPVVIKEENKMKENKVNLQNIISVQSTKIITSHKTQKIPKSTKPDSIGKGNGQ